MTYPAGFYDLIIGPLSPFLGQLQLKRRNLCVAESPIKQMYWEKDGVGGAGWEFYTNRVGPRVINREAIPRRTL